MSAGAPARTPGGLAPGGLKKGGGNARGARLPAQRAGGRGLGSLRKPFLGRPVDGGRSEEACERRGERGEAVCCSASAGGDGMTIAVTGATGLIGVRLVARLSAHGHRVKVLTRSPGRAREKLPYRGLAFVDPSQWDSAVCGCDGVVNLAGEPIATRWTPALKQEIKRSRVATTKRIVAAINRCSDSSRPGVLVNASAVGFYGTSEESLNEHSPSGTDYLAQICREWEAAAKQAKDVRVVVLRTGIVLAKEGGALGRMLPVFNLFAGGPLGSGRQWVSWIHRDDVVSLIMAALTNPAYSGAYNATAPNPVRMADFCGQLGSILGRPSWLPVPQFALQTLLGEGAMLVVDGQRVLPSRTQSTGFVFKYEYVGPALRNVMER